MKKRPANTQIKKACVVMPTYNEAQNINRTLDRIDEEARAVLPHTQLHVLIVDDNSPDGTAQLVRERSDYQDTVHLLVRHEKQGLGAAYIDGMQHAQRECAPDAILEMDADGSHDPSDIPRLLRALERGYDVAIGSRYVDGGELPADWGAHRRVMSSAANAASRLLLSIDGVRDCTGGFRAIRASKLAYVDLESIDTAGYVFQVVLLDTLLRNGARVTEVPISFHEREAGESKISVRDVIEGGTRLARIAVPRWAEVLR